MDTHGFKLIEKRFDKEVNADCHYYEHLKAGIDVELHLRMAYHHLDQ